jgi:hypothetical protein
MEVLLRAIWWVDITTFTEIHILQIDSGRKSPVASINGHLQDELT